MAEKRMNRFCQKEEKHLANALNTFLSGIMSAAPKKMMSKPAPYKIMTKPVFSRCLNATMPIELLFLE